ncbi:MAG: ATP-binding protein [Methanosarcinales archaeon]|nr:ATP-binding protein [ANME-2 cluster archaeon]MDW7775500.1 ATP-binding protein [Methanosarcinales archaeon]
MLEQSIRLWNPWWAEKKMPQNLTGIKRDVTDSIITSLDAPHIKDVIGVRRSGKTTVLYQTAAYLMDIGVAPEHIVFLNFDDPAINAAPLDDTFSSIYKINPEISHIFLDEIQQKKGWERWVRTLYDTKRFSQIFLSGSSASLLTQDLGRVLSGRHITFNIMPFSFREYLKKNGWENFETEYLIYKRKEILYYQKKYLEDGGFPETIGMNEFNQKKILTSLYGDIIARDILARFGASYEVAAKICLLMITNSTSEYSFNSVAKATHIALETAEKYIGYLKESLLINDLSVFSYKLKSPFNQNKKTYAVDTGLRNAVSFRITSDPGKLAENAVFLEHKRRSNEVYYWKSKGGYEVDFVQKIGQNVQVLLQVSWDVRNDKTRKREERSLCHACEEFGIDIALILTEDTEDIVERNGVKITYYPLWKWLLDI